MPALGGNVPSVDGAHVIAVLVPTSRPEALARLSSRTSAVDLKPRPGWDARGRMAERRRRWRDP